MAKTSMNGRALEEGACAGIDVGKARLDCAVDGVTEVAGFPNDPSGWEALATHLAACGVVRIGLEATGGYEQGVRVALERHGFRVSRFGPQRVRAYAKVLGLRAKTDRIDAGLIAAFTAAMTAEPPKRTDQRLDELAGLVRLYEQIKESIASWKTRREGTEPALATQIDEIVRDHEIRAKHLLRQAEARIRAHADLAERLDLMLSVPGVGLPTAVVLLVRMPELGQASREEAAALAGLAPFDDESGQRKGAKHIAGGRARPRKALFAAAMVASLRWNPALVALRRRLIARGKAYRSVIVACARKLLGQINAVLTRRTPWTEAPS
ncbi:MAG: IS110 family transposase [Salinarimonas sp.]